MRDIIPQCYRLFKAFIPITVDYYVTMPNHDLKQKIYSSIAITCLDYIL